ncbi:MAG: sigma-70 family RNA polymerase sigma factor [Deltaproteobacteria bacterium]
MTAKEDFWTNRPFEGQVRPPISATDSDGNSPLAGLGEPVRCALGDNTLTPSLGPELAFDQVYDAHFDFVWRSLRLLGVADELLEDAIQDTFSVVARQLAGFEGRSALRTWLFAILNRVAANYRRTRKRKQSQLLPWVEMASDAPGPDSRIEAVETARMVESFCSQLAPDRRALFVLAVLEELPAAEVAATLGMPINKVYSRLHALREALRSALREREVRGA